jgi:hypothetical protein
LASNRQSEVNGDIARELSVNNVRLDLLPVLHVVLHFSEVNALLVVDVHGDLFDGLVPSEAILDDLDLLQAVGTVQAIE